MRVHIKRWVNSVTLRIPESLAAGANLQDEAEFDLSFADGKRLISPVDAPMWTLEQLLQGVTPENLHGEAETGPAVGAEAW